MPICRDVIQVFSLESSKLGSHCGCVSTLALLDRTGRQAGDDSALEDEHQQDEGY